MTIGNNNTPGASQTVLYVEDNPLNALVVRSILKARRPEITLIIADTGAAALEQLRKKAPDFLLIDIILPDTNGVDLLKSIRANAAWRHIPAAATSATMPPDEIKSLLDAGFGQFLLKPINTAQLLQVLTAAGLYIAA